MDTNKKPKRADIILLELISTAIPFYSEGYLVPGGFIPFAQKFAETTRDLKLDNSLLMGAYERTRDLMLARMRDEINAAFQAACNPITRVADLPTMAMVPSLIATNMERALLDSDNAGGFYRAFSEVPYLRRVLEEAARPEHGVTGKSEVQEHLDKINAAIRRCQVRVGLS